MNLSIKQKQTHRQKIDLWLPRWGGWRERLGVWNQQMQTILYRMDKQQGPAV